MHIGPKALTADPAGTRPGSLRAMMPAHWMLVTCPVTRRRMRSGRPFAKGTRLWQTNKMTQSGGTAPTAGEP